MQDSEGLVLEVFRHDAGLKMSVFEQRQSSSTLRHYSLCAMDPAEIIRISREIIIILNKADKQGLLSADLLERLKKEGLLLWDSVLSRAAKDKLKNSLPQGNLTIFIDDELIDIPWELLYDGKNFLCLNFNLGRLVRTKGENPPMRCRSVSSALRMLILANPTNDLKSAYLEGLNIKNQFDRKRPDVRIDFKSSLIDKIYLKKNLADYDIVHFAGHCEFSPESPQDTGWVLNDGKFSARDILNMADSNSLPALVFSNACYSAKAAGQLIGADYQQKNYSLAAAFLFSGVRHYLGAIRRLEDPVSFEFAKSFYARLLSGSTVGEALRLGRLQLVKLYGLQAIPWASYLLYGDPDFAFFPKKEKLISRSRQKKAYFAKKIIFWFSAAAAAAGFFLYLYIWLPSFNPSTYYLYLNAKRLFSQGQNQAAMSLAQRLIQREADFLAIYPIIGDTYLRQGDKINALRSYFDYALYSEKKQDQKNLAGAYLKIGWFYQLQGQYQKAEDFFHKAIALSRKAKDKLNEAAGLRKLAVWYIEKADYNQALALLTKSAEINRSRQNNFAHRYNLACDYFDLGLVFANKNDFAAARDFYQKSRKLFEGLKLKSELGDYYFNIGEAYLFEKEFQKAKENYLKGLSIDEAQGNKMSLVSDYDMLGELYLEMEDPQQAEKYFQKAIALAREIDSPAELALASHNLGLLYKQQGKINKAREALRQAQEIYRQIDPASYEEVKKELLE